MFTPFFKSSLIASLFLFGIWGCASQTTQAPTPEDPVSSAATGTIVLGDISDDPTKKIKRYQPFADYLASQLNDVGISQGAVQIVPDLDTMIQYLKSGEVDLYFDSPYPAMRTSEESGATPILRRWKKGVEFYHTIIFTRADSAITNLEDLNGNIIAFDEAVSTSGYMLPLAHLKKAGLTITEKDTVSTTISTDEVGYVFSEDDDNSIQWTLTQRVDAAAVGSSDFAKIPEEARQQLRILAETEAVPRQVVMVSPTLAPEEVSAIIEVLLTIGETEAEKEILEKFEKTTKFDEFPGGVDAAFQRIRELYDLTQE
ncbi:MAG: phosphate/phosphite/phosphonate ABC transporter substrate-binding protein [Spirulina sp. SIO3F2]|nr:phosphate/phosphite/phosphonate ABC transporter substrate-binding protein [Spirulina sp. SIO3F2]